MFLYVLRRVLVTIPLLFASSILVFLMVINIGTPQKIENFLARPNPNPAALAALRRQFGTDKGFVERYWDWITKFVRLDWGENYNGIEIRGLIWEKAQVSLRLLIFASLLSVLIGVAIGAISALRQYTVFDFTVTFTAFFFFSIPTLVLGIVMKRVIAIQSNPWLRSPSMSSTVMLSLLVFGLAAGFLIMKNRYKYEKVKPPGKYVLGAVVGLSLAAIAVVVFKVVWDGNVYRKGNNKPLIPTIGQATQGFEGGFAARQQDYFWHLLLPSLTLVLVGFAGYSRFMRASMLETLNADYVRTARAKGLSERRVTIRHAMRNALLPVVTLVALDLGSLIGGAIVTESVFAWKGMGSFFAEALTEKDPRMLLAFVMVTAVSVVLFNVIADVLYAKLDPRIRLG
jgi:peptide/nickel transport system permease protein